MAHSSHAGLWIVALVEPMLELHRRLAHRLGRPSTATDGLVYTRLQDDNMLGCDSARLWGERTGPAYRSARTGGRVTPDSRPQHGSPWSSPTGAVGRGGLHQCLLQASWDTPRGR